MMPEQIAPSESDNKRARNRTIAIAVMVFVVVAVSIIWYGSGERQAGNMSPTAAQQQKLDPDARAPEGVRVRVTVLNGTDVRGLARRATNLVRDLGYDVVEYGNADSKTDSTMILVHTGHTDWARRLALGVGGARIDNEPDSLRYVDLTLVIGSNWNPPAQPFRP